MTNKKEPISRQIAILYRQELSVISSLLEGCGITFAQLPFIMELYGEHGVTQDYLADKVQVDKANVTRTLKQMEQKGLITRKANKEDARSKLVYLTDSAFDIKSDLLVIVKKWNRIIEEGLTENEIETVKQANKKMIRNAKKFRDEMKKGSA